MPHIVLASKSPRRHELLRRMGITDFSVVVPDVEETYPEGLAPQEIVAHIARLKSDAAAPLVGPEDILITADTMVFWRMTGSASRVTRRTRCGCSRSWRETATRSARA